MDVVTRTARVFWSGRSQAVRLPKDFRVPGETVRIRKHGSSVVLEPIADDWSWLDEIIGEFSDDFFADGRNQPPLDERDELDHAPG